MIQKWAMSNITEGSAECHCLRGGLLVSRPVAGASGLWKEVATAGVLCSVALCTWGLRHQLHTDHVHAVETWLLKLSFTGLDLNCFCVFCDAVFTFRTINRYLTGALLSITRLFPSPQQHLFERLWKANLEYWCQRKPEWPVSLQY